MLVEENVDMNGARVVIVGRSKLVGMPLAALLLQKGPGANSTVTVCHTGTRDIAAETRRADVLVAATGNSAALLTLELLISAAVVGQGVLTFAQFGLPALRTLTLLGGVMLLVFGLMVGARSAFVALTGPDPEPYIGLLGLLFACQGLATILALWGEARWPGGWTDERINGV